MRSFHMSLGWALVFLSLGFSELPSRAHAQAGDGTASAELIAIRQQFAKKDAVITQLRRQLTEAQTEIARLRTQLPQSHQIKALQRLHPRQSPTPFYLQMSGVVNVIRFGGVYRGASSLTSVSILQPGGADQAHFVRRAVRTVSTGISAEAGAQLLYDCAREVGAAAQRDGTTVYIQNQDGMDIGFATGAAKMTARTLKGG